MANSVSVKVHCKNTDQWYDIDSSTDIDGLITEIQEQLDVEEDEMVTEIDIVFDEWEVPSLLKGLLGADLDENIPLAIEALENAVNDLEVYEAYQDNIGTVPSSLNDIEELIENADEAYQGEYKDDETFAENLADELGYLNKQMSWPYNCIDWERAASELMYDYFESNGHYFRNI